MLNVAGEYVLRYARAIKELEDELVTNMESGSSTRTRELTVGADESAKDWVKACRLVRLRSLKEVKEEYWIGMMKRAIDNKQLKNILASL